MNRQTNLKSLICLAVLVLGGVSTPSASAAPSIEWPLDIDEVRTKQHLEELRRELALEPEDGFVHVAKDVDIRVEANRVIQTVRHIFYYGTSAIVQKYATDKVSWDSSREQLRFLGVHVFNADGDIHAIDPATVRVTDTSSSDVFTDGKEIVLQLPGLSADAFSVLSYERILPDTAPYFFFDYLTGSTAIRRNTMSVSWHGRAQPNFRIDEGYLTCTHTAARIQCSGEDLPSGTLDSDVYYRDALPNWIVATPQSWQDVIDTTLNDIAWAANADEGLEAVMRDLRPLNPLAAEAAAQHFAAQQIRYVSFSEGEHSHRPHKISDTLRNRYGDCKDKSTLLLRLLRELGQNAYPVLVATSQEQPQRMPIPSNGYFDHMIVCVEDDDGSERCLDPTASFASAHVTPAWVQNKARLNLVNGATPSRLPVSKTRWQFHVDSEITFDETGAQVEITERKYLKEYASWLREQLATLSSKEKGEWLTQLYQESVAESSSPAFAISGEEDLDAPLIIRSTTAYEPTSDPEEELSYTEAAYWVRDIAHSLKVNNTHYGAHFPGFRAKSSIEFKFNNLWQDVSGTAHVDFDSKYGEMRRKFISGEDSLRVATSVTVPERFIAADEIEDFNRFLDLIRDEAIFTLYGEANDS